MTNADLSRLVHDWVYAAEKLLFENGTPPSLSTYLNKRPAGWNGSRAVRLDPPDQRQGFFWQATIGDYVVSEGARPTHNEKGDLTSWPAGFCNVFAWFKGIPLHEQPFAQLKISYGPSGTAESCAEPANAVIETVRPYTLDEIIELEARSLLRWLLTAIHRAHDRAQERARMFEHAYVAALIHHGILRTGGINLDVL
jgi:hypothetical protein